MDSSTSFCSKCCKMRPIEDFLQKRKGILNKTCIRHTKSEKCLHLINGMKFWMRLKLGVNRYESCISIFDIHKELITLKIDTQSYLRYRIFFRPGPISDSFWLAVRAKRSWIPRSSAFKSSCEPACQIYLAKL